MAAGGVPLIKDMIMFLKKMDRLEEHVRQGYTHPLPRRVCLISSLRPVGGGQRRALQPGGLEGS